MSMRPQLSHVGIYVFETDRMVAFYKDVLGLEVTDRGMSRSAKAPITFMSSNPSQHHQFVLVEGRAAEARSSTVNQLSFKVESLDELRGVATRAGQHGAKLRLTNHGNAWSIYFPDPEGNQIEVYVDTPWHVAQPHGEPLDLSLSDESILAATEKSVRADSTFMLREERQAALARRWYPES